MASRRFLKEIKSLYQVNKTLMPEAYIIVRVDGKNFKKICEYYKFLKPNDQCHVNLMNKCAIEIFKIYKNDIILSYGFSDEFSFAFCKQTILFNRNFR